MYKSFLCNFDDIPIQPSSLAVHLRIFLCDSELSSFGLQSGSLFCPGSSDSGHFCLDFMRLLRDLVQSGWIRPETW